jgi:hypothetical protein
MDLAVYHNTLNFYINKYQGRYYTPDELDKVLDNGSLSLFSELRPKYATSQRMQDALAVFLDTYDFNTTNSISGTAVIPSDANFIALLSIDILYNLSGRGTIYEGVPIVSKDEKSIRLRSQLDPVTEISPIAEVIAPRYYRIYPLQGYNGTITFFRRPVAPHFAYTTISGRIIVYDAANSTQLEWGDDFAQSVILKSLESLGINLSDQEITQFAELKTMQNFQNVNNT